MGRAKSRTRRVRPRPRATAAYGVSAGSNAGRPGSRPLSWYGNIIEAFDEWLTETLSVRWTAVMLVVAICAAVAFDLGTRAKLHEQEVFDKAPLCASAADTDCKVERTATIQNKDYVRSKPRTYYLVLADSQGSSGRIDLPSSKPLWEYAVVGDDVTVLSWHGHPVRVIDGDVAGDTLDAPAWATVTYEVLLASALVWVVAFAALSLRIFQVGRWADNGWNRVLVPVNPVALTAVIFFPIGSLVGRQSGSFLVALVSGAAVPAFTSLYLLVNWLRHR